MARWRRKNPGAEIRLHRTAGRRTRKRSSSRIKTNIAALVLNLCESNLRLAVNLSSGVRGGSVQVLANALAAHERAAHRPTETHNAEMSLPESNQEAV